MTTTVTLDDGTSTSFSGPRPDRDYGRTEESAGCFVVRFDFGDPSISSSLTYEFMTYVRSDDPTDYDLISTSFPPDLSTGSYTFCVEGQGRARAGARARLQRPHERAHRAALPDADGGPHRAAHARPHPGAEPAALVRADAAAVARAVDDADGAADARPLGGVPRPDGRLDPRVDALLPRGGGLGRRDDHATLLDGTRRRLGDGRLLQTGGAAAGDGPDRRDHLRRRRRVATDAATAESTYGHISTWDTSQVTDMADLFCTSGSYGG